jgi:hypothetical protein
MNDPIVDEVRRVRDAHAARFNYDLDAIFQDIKEQEKKSGRKFVSLPLKNEQMTSEEKTLLADRVRRWASKPELIVHKIIGLVARSNEGIPRDRLVQAVEFVTSSKDPYGAVRSLCTSKANNFGRILEEADGVFRLHPALAEIVHSYRWSCD